MKKYALMFLIVFVIFTFVTFVGIQLDLLANSWLRHAVQDWKWYNYFTTRHGLTALYINNGWLWLVPAFILSAIASSFVSFFINSRDQTVRRCRNDAGRDR